MKDVGSGNDRRVHDEGARRDEQTLQSALRGQGLEDGNKSVVFGRARTADHFKSTRGWVGWVERAEQKNSDQLAVGSGVVALLPDAVFRKVETEILRCDELVELLCRE